MTKHMIRRPPPPEIAERCRAYAEAFGVTNACKMLNVAPATLARMVAHLPVRGGSVRLVAAALRERDRAAEARRIREGEP